MCSTRYVKLTYATYVQLTIGCFRLLGEVGLLLFFCKGRTGGGTGGTGGTGGGTSDTGGGMLLEQSSTAFDFYRKL